MGYIFSIFLFWASSIWNSKTEIILQKPRNYIKLIYSKKNTKSWRTLIHKVEKILKGSLDSIPSPPPFVKIQIRGGKVWLRCKGKTLLGFINKLLKTKSLLTSPSNFLPLHIKQFFLSIIEFSLKVRTMRSKLSLSCKDKTLLCVINKLLKTKSLLTSPSNVLTYYFK